jgi:hypothetical protein
MIVVADASPLNYLIQINCDTSCHSSTSACSFLPP